MNAVFFSERDTVFQSEFFFKFLLICSGYEKIRALLSNLS